MSSEKDFKVKPVTSVVGVQGELWRSNLLSRFYRNKNEVHEGSSTFQDILNKLLTDEDRMIIEEELRDNLGSTSSGPKYQGFFSDISFYPAIFNTKLIYFSYEDFVKIDNTLAFEEYTSLESYIQFLFEVAQYLFLNKINVEIVFSNIGAYKLDNALQIENRNKVIIIADSENDLGVHMTLSTFMNNNKRVFFSFKTIKNVLIEKFCFNVNPDVRSKIGMFFDSIYKATEDLEIFTYHEDKEDLLAPTKKKFSLNRESLKIFRIDEIFDKNSDLRNKFISTELTYLAEIIKNERFNAIIETYYKIQGLNGKIGGDLDILI